MNKPEATGILQARGERAPEATIELRSVTKVYQKKVRALDGISFRIEQGERACLLGPNGAGKTTIIRLLNGAITPTCGEVLLGGISSDGDDYLAVRRQTGVVPQGPGMYDDLTCGEYLSLAKQLYGSGDTAKWVDHLGLSSYLDRPMAHLSGGFQRRVVLAAALLADPEILLLDEPTVGLDPLAEREVRGYLKEAMAGRTILLCTHNLAEAEALCDSVVIIQKGRVLLHDRIETLRHRFTARVHLAATVDVQALGKTLTELGLSPDIDGGGVWVTVAEPEMNVPNLLRRLLDSGLDIFECHIVEPSLEDLFVNIIEGDASR